MKQKKVVEIKWYAEKNNSVIFFIYQCNLATVKVPYSIGIKKPPYLTYISSIVKTVSKCNHLRVKS
jgi:hypothetical protein